MFEIYLRNTATKEINEGYLVVEPHFAGLDDTKIKVFINPRSSQLKEILIQFKITSFSHFNGKYEINLSEPIYKFNVLSLN